VLFAHLSDLHLRDAGDVTALEQQLDRIAARAPVHLAITGDLLDRWDPRLLERVLDVLDARGFLDAQRLTILHGNHDLASSGGYPRQRRDLWRLAWRFWDPPPLVASRKRRFYQTIHDRAAGVARQAPWSKTLNGGLTIAVIDTVPVHWWPVGWQRRALTVKHAEGCVRHEQLEWLTGQTSPVLLVHHFPLEAPQFAWQTTGGLRWLIDEVRVPMAIPQPGRTALQQAAARAGTRLLLCGHVHRARLEWHDGIAVGLNGQSGAEWAQRTIAFYDIGASAITAAFEPGV
jgi:UDP-2,3-diacylglucosamine pyrophosphatase LpxH